MDKWKDGKYMLYGNKEDDAGSAAKTGQAMELQSKVYDLIKKGITVTSFYRSEEMPQMSFYLQKFKTNTTYFQLLYCINIDKI